MVMFANNGPAIINAGPKDTFSNIKDNSEFVINISTYNNKDKINNLSKKNINIFSLELLPRITRAQSMDVLSSQSNLAGYKAVIDSFSNFKKVIWTECFFIMLVEL